MDCETGHPKVLQPEMAFDPASSLSVFFACVLGHKTKPGHMRRQAPQETAN
jgi:hypothetical protein